jgi:hypothetical protein
MIKNLVVWTLFVTVLLVGINAIAADYTIIPEKRGEVVQRDGNNVTDAFIESDVACGIEVDDLRTKLKESPKEEARGFTMGLTWGAFGGIILMLLI